MKNNKELNTRELLEQLKMRLCNSFTTEEQVRDMLGRYGGYEQFCRVFSPELQEVAAGNIVRTYAGTAPRLSVLAEGYGRQEALRWICLHLQDMNGFSNVRLKLTAGQQISLSSLILRQYGYLKASELLFYFYRVKQGCYGAFSYAIEPTFFTHSLQIFITERRKQASGIYEQLMKMQSSPQAASGERITYEEYLQRKNSKKK